jgi:heptose I phosphotransferase
MTSIFLDAPFDALWKGKDPFCEVASLGGEEFRHVKSRRTFRVEIDGCGFFVKHHHGVGWKEIFKDLFQFKVPVTGADGEYKAIRHLEKLGVPTMSCAGFGQRFFNHAGRESFIITRELAGMCSLEDFFAGNEVTPEMRRDIAVRLGRSVGKMHAGGLNHRDCYICHFLRSPESGELHVIDLHRAQIRKKVPFRYAVKDVAGILFSSMHLGLTYRDILLFYREYKRAGNKDSRSFRDAVFRTARKLYVKEYAGVPPEIRK